MSHLPATLQVALGALVPTVAAYDIRSRRISNWLVLIGFTTGLSMNIWMFSAQGIRTSCLGAAAAFGVYFQLFALRAMGAGDLKLMLAVAAFTGAYNWIVLFVIRAVLGATIAVILILYRAEFNKTIGNVLIVLGELLHLRAPYHKNPELDVGIPGPCVSLTRFRLRAVPCYF